MEKSWIELETNYITDINKISLRGIAEQNDVSYQHVRRYAAQNNWTHKREQYATSLLQKTKEKVADFMSNDAAATIKKHFEVSSRLLEILEGAISMPGEFNKVIEKLRVDSNRDEWRVIEIGALAEKRVETVVNSLVQLQKMQWETLSIMSEMERVKAERLRLEMEKKKGASVSFQVYNDGFIEALKGHEVAALLDSIESGQDGLKS